ncbi:MULTISPECIES: thiolase family protein [Mycolicibacter]|uniref:Thiolase family protein n=1 Tax=Mycolicibacter kumamotonensis TaxID=354243 RepID=A0A7K3LCK0_9MYCO|nr:thiolase family protein [Mycolicibacter senuensis]NDJ90094.1 thiolase family protein [Mycolicibacter kumamotonensis]RAV01811.1 thiolase family protein [Mycolicibacter senuensis]
MSAKNDVAIVGVGLHPFGRHGDKLALQMGVEAARAALADAGTEWAKVQTAFVGSYEVSNPDAIVGWLGLTGIPVRAVFNGCATGGTSLQMAAAAIRNGEADVAMAIGMDKHPRGAFAADPAVVGQPAWYGQTGLFLTTHFFGTKINRYMGLHGISADSLARIAAKNLHNGSITPHAWRRKPVPAEVIRDSEVVNYPLTRYMYCNPCEGAAAVVLCRGDLARSFTSTPVYVRASELRTRRHGAFEVQSPSLPLQTAPSPTVDASRAAYAAAGIGPEEVQVAQLQDTDAGSELIHMAENGFCGDGEQEQWIADGRTDIGGALPVNTDGGLIANGEPIGASGLRQIYETVLQLQGRAGDRQVPGRPRVGYTHLYGAPGASAVSILSR